MKKKNEAFFNWLNQTIFWDNYQNCKTTKAQKRVILCKSHKKATRRY